MKTVSRGQVGSIGMGRPAIVEPAPLPLAESELVARLFRALGHSTRVRIIEFLLESPRLNQAKIVRRLQVTQGHASEHLGCLVWCGFSSQGGDRRGHDLLGVPADATVPPACPSLPH